MVSSGASPVPAYNAYLEGLAIESQGVEPREPLDMPNRCKT